MKKVSKKEIWPEQTYGDIYRRVKDYEVATYIFSVYNSIPRNNFINDEEYTKFVLAVKDAVNKADYQELLDGTPYKNLCKELGIDTDKEVFKMSYGNKFYQAINLEPYGLSIINDDSSLIPVEDRVNRRVLIRKVKTITDEGFIYEHIKGVEKYFLAGNLDSVYKGCYVVFDRFEDYNVVVCEKKKDAKVEAEKLKRKLFRDIKLSNELYAMPINKQVCRKENINSSYDSANKLRNEFQLRDVKFATRIRKSDYSTILCNVKEAINDLSEIIKIKPKNISFNGSLSLSFGRDKPSYANAAMDPLTKNIGFGLQGAGNFAHEWMHALDLSIGQKFDISELATDYYDEKDICLMPEIDDVISCMRYNEDGSKTLFYRQSLQFDESLDETFNNSYWSSSCEMLARTFEKYVNDRMVKKSLFLVRKKPDNVMEPRYHKKEKDRVYAAMDRLLIKCKKLGII